MNKNIIMKNNGTTIIELIICIIIIFIIVVTALPIVLKYAREKGQKDAINEYKIEQYEKSLPGMNYNNTEGWYKDCKMKIFYSTEKSENEINEFISNKDVVDIKMSSNHSHFYIIVIYTDSLKGNKYEEIN